MQMLGKQAIYFIFLATKLKQLKGDVHQRGNIESRNILLHGSFNLRAHKNALFSLPPTHPPSLSLARARGRARGV